jgi:hypothetical protein
MELMDSLKMYLRLFDGLKRLARERITLDQAREFIRRGLESREENFLLLLERGVFGYPKSPYLPLMRQAGCELGDIRNMLKAQGLEATLFNLRKEGVYIGFEEMKGRVPLVRGNLTLQVKPDDFFSPLSQGQYLAETGGTTGPGRRIPTEVDYQAKLAPMVMMTRYAHASLELPTALWRGPIPDGSGLNRVIAHTKANLRIHKWFTADLRGKNKPKLNHRILDKGFLGLMRWWKVPLPKHHPLPLDQAIVAAGWAHEACRRDGGCCVITPVGRAVRVASAAKKAGLDLSGVIFELGGEPATQAKVDAITSSGARCYHTYAMHEFGQLATGCANPTCVDDMHMAMHCFGLISYPFRLPGEAGTVNALNITSLLPNSPLIMINAQVDDHGVVEHRACGCPLDELGLTQHVSKVSSYSKLVVEGITLIGSDVVRILEEVLPSRFGGEPTDYQLMEKENPSGGGRIYLLVSPRVNLPNDQAAAGVFLEALKKGPDCYTWARSIWSQGEVLKVLRKEPYSSARGKHLTLWKLPRNPD